MPESEDFVHSNLPTTPASVDDSSSQPNQDRYEIPLVVEESSLDEEPKMTTDDGMPTTLETEIRSEKQSDESTDLKNDKEETISEEKQRETERERISQELKKYKNELETLENDKRILELKIKNLESDLCRLSVEQKQQSSSEETVKGGEKEKNEKLEYESINEKQKDQNETKPYNNKVEIIQKKKRIVEVERKIARYKIVLSELTGRKKKPKQYFSGGYSSFLKCRYKSPLANISTVNGQEQDSKPKLANDTNAEHEIANSKLAEKENESSDK